MSDKSPNTNMSFSLCGRRRSVFGDAPFLDDVVVVLGLVVIDSGDLGYEASEGVDRVTVFRVLPNEVVQMIGDFVEGDLLGTS